MTAWADMAARHGGRTSFCMLAGAAVLAFILMPYYNVVDYDVAFLTWAADRMLHGAVYGRDIFEINPPLCIMIYMPAAWLGQFIGLEWGVRLWMLLLTLASLSCLWQTAGKQLRLPVAVMLLLFVSLAFPNHFGQREQIVLLLCAPYVAGPAPDKRIGWLSGVMAALGFFMKPYFVIPLALVFALRRRIGPEERVIVITGIGYALAVLIFFPTYLSEMVPVARATYWALSFPLESLVSQTVFVLLLSVPLAFAGTQQAETRQYLAATLGFTAAAVIQQKGFVYHFIPAYGFAALYLAARSCDPKRRIAMIAIVYLLVEGVMIMQAARYWRSVYASTEKVDAELKAEIDRSASYVSFLPEPYPGFPLAIHTPSRYAGIAICPIFITAVAKLSLGLAQGDPSRANELALSQALRELVNRPEIVITLNGSYDVEGRQFDILDWYKRDPRFAKAWSAYVPDRQIGAFRLYRRQ